MGFIYLKGKKWQDISRDERYFCAELFFEIKKDPISFVKWLNDRIILKSSKLDLNSEWEVGFEVCFFRDYVFEIGEKNENKSIRNSKYSPKRTFDLCLFSEMAIIIIEAKAYCGFDSMQLKSFKDDKESIKSLLGEKCPSVVFLALVSSLYKPKQASMQVFDNKITWEEMYNLYNNRIFQRANKSEIVVNDL